MHYIVFSHFYLFTYVQLQHGHVARNPKKESHMAHTLYMNYSKYSNYSDYSNYLNYSKLAVGKFHHSFCGQLFFRLILFGCMESRTGPIGSWLHAVAVACSCGCIDVQKYLGQSQSSCAQKGKRKWTRPDLKTLVNMESPRLFSQ